MTLPKNNLEEELYEILIFYTNIFLLGIDINVINAQIYTSHQIIAEIKKGDKNRNILFKIQAAIDTHKLIIRSPSESYIQEINKIAKTTGDYKALSEADKELLALTLELNNTSEQGVLLYTNDYSMENLCSELEIPFSPLLKKGIKSKIIWQVYCPHCKDVFKSEDLNQTCERCGSKLKRP